MGDWDVSLLTDLDEVFDSYSGPDFDLNNWDVSGVTTMHKLFRASTFNGNISGWNTASVA